MDQTTAFHLLIDRVVNAECRHRCILLDHTYQRNVPVESCGAWAHNRFQCFFARLVLFRDIAGLGFEVFSKLRVKIAMSSPPCQTFHQQGCPAGRLFFLLGIA